jgi:hypothetical protein
MTPYLSAMTVTVEMTKTTWGNPKYSIVINGEEMSMEFQASRKLTQTCGEDGQGIFDTEESYIEFKKGNTWVAVNFGDAWDIAEYSNPALEIDRRVNLVNKAFIQAADDRNESLAVTL